MIVLIEAQSPLALGAQIFPELSAEFTAIFYRQDGRNMRNIARYGESQASGMKNF